MVLVKTSFFSPFGVIFRHQGDLKLVLTDLGAVTSSELPRPSGVSMYVLHYACKPVHLEISYIRPAADICSTRTHPYECTTSDEYDLIACIMHGCRPVRAESDTIPRWFAYVLHGRSPSGDQQYVTPPRCTIPYRVFICSTQHISPTARHLHSTHTHTHTSSYIKHI